MKRTAKPFSVEIKKSRASRHYQQIPPKNLFRVAQVKTTEALQERVLQVAVQPPEPPRILPSILEPVWSNTETVESAAQDQPVNSEGDVRQIELVVRTVRDNSLGYAPVEVSVVLDAGQQMDVALIEEAVTLNAEAQPSKATRAKAKPRRKGTKPIEAEVAFEPTSPPKQTVTMEATDATAAVRSRKVVHPTRTKRQAAVAQLPRSERWKRRLHPAAW